MTKGQVYFCILLLGGASPARPQIVDLASNFTGSEVYFSAPASLRGTNAPQFSKIFRWSAGKGVEVYASRERVVEGYLTTFYALAEPSVSSDGDKIAFSAKRECGPAFLIENYRCGFMVDDSEGIVQTRAGEMVLQVEEMLQLSRNGRYALAGGACHGCGLVLYDLQAPIRPIVPTSECITAQFSSKQAVADDGTVASVCGDALYLLQTGKFRKYAQDSFLRTAPISARGNTVVYATWSEGRGGRLYALDTASGVETFLFEDPKPYVVPGPLEDPNPSVSDDGHLLLIPARESASSPRQWLVAIGSDGSKQDWFGYVAEGYTDAVLSGDGNIAFAVTASNRLMRSDLSTGHTTEIIPSSPRIEARTGALAGGSLNLIFGKGFANTAVSVDTFPASSTLGGVQVQYNGVALAMVEVRPDRLAAQIPWEWPYPDCGGINGPISPLALNLTISVKSGQQSPFDDPMLSLGVCTSSITNRDVLGPFDASGKPVGPPKLPMTGEDITLFTTGLGPVDPPVPTGVPGPTSPAAKLVNPLHCTFTLPFPSITGQPW